MDKFCFFVFSDLYTSVLFVEYIESMFFLFFGHLLGLGRIVLIYQI